MSVNKTLWFFNQEMRRMFKYKIMQISLLLALMWCVLLYFIGAEGAVAFLPLFLFVDASVMSMMMMGAILFYERQENTLKPLLVTPIGVSQVIMVRIVVGIIIALQSTLILGLFARFVLGVELMLLWWVLVVIIIAFTHGVLGFLVSLNVKDFNGLLASIVVYMFVFGFPSIFFALGMLSPVWENLLLFSPTHGAFLMIEHGVTPNDSLWVLAFSMVYLLGVGILLLIRYIIPRYALVGVKE